MLLINNTKTMMKFYLLLSVMVLSIVAGGYYYLNSMETTESGLNINKIEKIDNIYARSVYSDYFFRVMSYGQRDKGWMGKISFSKNDDSKNTFLEGYYSKLIPLKISMGYDFTSKKEPQFILKPFDMPIKDKFSKQVGSVNDDSFEDYIDRIEQFKNIFSKIVATQDQQYFIDSHKDIKRIISELFKEDSNITLPEKSIDEYYSVLDIPLKSLGLRHLNLEYFKIQHHLEKQEWQPNIASWVYGSSKISLQYLDKNCATTLNEFIKGIEKEKRELIIKTLKVNGTKVVSTYYIIDSIKNTISSHVMTKDGGHMFELKMRADSKASLLTGMHDFMKINSGLFSTDKEVDKWFIKKQRTVIDYRNKSQEIIEKISDLSDKLGKENTYKDLFTGHWDQVFENFKDTFHVYPNKIIYDKLLREYSALEKEDKEGSILNKMKIW